MKWGGGNSLIHWFMQQHFKQDKTMSENLITKLMTIIEGMNQDSSFIH